MTVEATKTGRVTARDVKRALWWHLTVRGWAVIEELTITAGGRARRIDVLCVRKPVKRNIGPLEFLAVEVKVSRGDFLTDVRSPEKQAPWREFAHRHAYAAPDGIINPSEVPDGSGLLTVSGLSGGARENVSWTVRAPYRDGDPPTVTAQAHLRVMFRLAEAEARRNGYYTLRDDDPADLRALLDQERKKNAALNTRLYQVQGAAERWRSYAGACTGLPCSTCTQPLRPSSVHQRVTTWRHVDPTHDQPCLEKRIADTDARLGAGTAARYYPPPEPKL